MNDRPTAEETAELRLAVSHFFRIGVQRHGAGGGDEIVSQLIDNSLKAWGLRELPAPLKAQIDADRRAILAEEASRPTDEQKERNRSDLIRLWTAASAAPKYDKQAWMAVERQLLTAGLI